jgi:hypothetical protein
LGSLLLLSLLNINGIFPCGAERSRAPKGAIR